MATSYLTHLPRKAMRAVAGWGQLPGNYHLKRGIAYPPSSLRHVIWPWVDVARQAYSSGQVQDADLSGRLFVDLMRDLRVVFLQDAAILKIRFPDLRVWSHPVFAHEDWPAFAESVLANEAVLEEPASVTLRKAVPAIAEGMQTLQTSITGYVETGTTQLASRLNKIETVLANGLADIARSQREQQFEGLVVVPRRAVKSAYYDTVFVSSSSSSSPESPPISHLSSQQPTASSGRSIPAASAPLPPSPQRTALLPVPPPPRPKDCPEGCHPIPVAVSMGDAREVWREWYQGLDRGEQEGRQMSILALDERFGSSWRYTNAIKTRYQNRKKLVKAIEALAQKRGVGANVVVEEVQRLPLSADTVIRRLSKKQSLDSILR